MKRLIVTTMLLLTTCLPALAQTTQPDARKFELTATAPPVPALTHQLLFNYSQRTPGNAAMPYTDAILLMGADTNDKTDQALAAYDSGDFKTFDSIADSLSLDSFFDELDVAGRMDDCDWLSPLRERGVRTMLPHLAPLARPMSKAIKVRALRQLRQGKIADALATLRLGYELSDKVGREHVVVASLVSLAIMRRTNDGLAQVMNDAKSPNLYWALAEFPGRQQMLRSAWDYEAWWLYLDIPELKKVRAGEDLTAAQWRHILIDDMAPFYILSEEYKTTGQRPHPDPIKDASQQVRQQAAAQYAAAHGMTADQVSQVDPAIVLGSFYFKQYQIEADDVAKWRGMSYPQLLFVRTRLNTDLARLKREQPANPFLEIVGDLGHAIEVFARDDRQLAALTAVEAIRSYAAANHGALPKRLEDITDTPVPLNPVTGKMFEYHVDNNAATIADNRTEDDRIGRLNYTVSIRK